MRRLKEDRNYFNKSIYIDFSMSPPCILDEGNVNFPPGRGGTSFIEECYLLLWEIWRVRVPDLHLLFLKCP